MRGCCAVFFLLGQPEAEQQKDSRDGRGGEMDVVSGRDWKRGCSAENDCDRNFSFDNAPTSTEFVDRGCFKQGQAKHREANVLHLCRGELK